MCIFCHIRLKNNFIMNINHEFLVKKTPFVETKVKSLHDQLLASPVFKYEGFSSLGSHTKICLLTPVGSIWYQLLPNLLDRLHDPLRER